MINQNLKGKKQYPKEITAGQTVDFEETHINKSEYSRKTPIVNDPSLFPIAGSPSVRLNGSVKYKPTSSYGHVLVPSHMTTQISRNNPYSKSGA